MKYLEFVLDFLKSATLITFTQLVSIFGIFFIFGLILYFFARSTRRVYVKSAGTTLDIILTGWIGTPVHELGHVVFCLLFFHKIDKIKLFDPNPKDGSIGYVHHSYNKKNMYHRSGNFFIGVGPIIFGSILLYLTMYFLVPGMKHIFTDIERHGITLINAELTNWRLIGQTAWNAIEVTLAAIIWPENFSNWRFWLFLYISISIASHMELSPPDLKSALGGFLILAIIIFFLNLLLILLQTVAPGVWLNSLSDHFSRHALVVPISRSTGIATAVFIYASVVSALNLLLSWFLLSIYTLISGRGIINPFWG